MESEYRRAPGLNYSLLSEYSRGPEYVGQTEDKEEFEFGKLFEGLLFDEVFKKDIWIDKYLVAPKIDKRTKAGKLAAAELAIKAEGKILITEESYAAMLRMIKNTLDMKLGDVSFRDIILKSERSVPIFWEKDGIAKKAEIDFYLPLEMIVYLFDLKSWHGAAHRKFKHEIQERYWIQAVHYREGLREQGYPDVSPMHFVVASKGQYNISRVVKMDDLTEKIAEEKYKKLVDDFCEWDCKGRPELGFREEVEEVTIYF